MSAAVPAADFSDLDPPPPAGKEPPRERSRRPPAVEADENWQVIRRMTAFLEAIALGKATSEGAESIPAAKVSERIEAARAAGMIAAKAVDLYGLPLEGKNDLAKRAAVVAARRAAARAAHAGSFKGHAPEVPKAWATSPGDAAPVRGLNWESEPLGQVRDRVIAQKFGIGTGLVTAERERRGIPPFDEKRDPQP